MDKFCGRAMPYIKAKISDEPGPHVTLPLDDSPVLRDLENGLLVAYVVDSGQSLDYVQKRHLAAAGISADDLHVAAMKNLVSFMGTRTRMHPHGNIFGMLLDGNFEASLL